MVGEGVILRIENWGIFLDFILKFKFYWLFDNFIVRRLVMNIINIESISKFSYCID